MDLKIGDIVFLKSESRLLMTISDFSSMGSDYFICYWFSGTELKKDFFHKDCLQRV